VLSKSLLPIVFLMLETGLSSYSADDEAAGAAAPPELDLAGAAPLNFSTSSCKIRPAGPVPLTSPNGMPFSIANRRAEGVAKILDPEGPTLEGWVGALAGVSVVPTAVRAEGGARAPEELTEGWGSSAFLGASAGEGLEEEEEEDSAFWESDLGMLSAASEPSAARASAPERSSPSSATMAMRDPTGRPLAPSWT
jgi:hypothetical protein